MGGGALVVLFAASMAKILAVALIRLLPSVVVAIIYPTEHNFKFLGAHGILRAGFPTTTTTPKMTKCKPFEMELYI